MPIHIKLLIIFIVLVSFSGCGSLRKIDRAKISTDKNYESDSKTNKLENKKSDLKRNKISDINEYIKRFSEVAQEEMKRYKIPASITLAQGILESGVGGGRLALKANNHFGIKCHKEWKGKKIYHDDDKKGECFRVYKNPITSYRDHSVFLSQRSRYDFLFNYKITNYKAWAKGLKKAGYATDPKYPDKLIEIIERYKLYRYDNKRLLKKTELSNLVIKYHKVTKGDTLYSISKKYGVSIQGIIDINKMNNNNIFLDQILEIPKTNN
tara:strand:+ start:371 stop:1171 length:801 start_codon:yes stop_codon:yes gene_type:complete